MPFADNCIYCYPVQEEELFEQRTEKCSRSLPPEDTVPEDKQTTVIVDVEAQKKDPSEYKILNRAVFYVGRLLSSEKERDFTDSDYDAIKSVYSIWICMNKKENSITRFRFAGEDLVGSGRWKRNYGR